MNAPLRVLVLFDIRFATQNRISVLDQVQFLSHASADRVQITYVNLTDRTPFDPQWETFDVVLLHGTVLEWRWHKDRTALETRIAWLAAFDGLVAAMPQDECLFAHELDDMLAVHNVRLVLTLFDEATCAVLYPRVHRSVQFVRMLPTYIHPGRARHLASHAAPLTARPIDVFHRGSAQPFWFGALAQRKQQLIVQASHAIDSHAYAVDLSLEPESLVMADAWLTALGSARITLGAEGGYGVLDRRGEIGMVVRALVADQPALSFEQVDAYLEGELSRQPYPTLAPRHLEAAMTGTAQLLMEGSYDGVLEPWVHYIPLTGDSSDIASTVRESLADTALLERITQQAHAEIVESGRYTWGVLAERFLDAVAQLELERAASASLRN